MATLGVVGRTVGKSTMKNYSAIVCASVLALALSACGGGETSVGDDGSTTQPDAGVAVGDVSEPDAAGEAVPVPAVPFGNADLVTSPINAKVRSLPSLTPSASADARINSTSSGKSDPFSGRVISVRPVPPEPEEVVANFPLSRQPGRSPSSDLGNAIAGGDTSNSTVGGTGRSGRPVAVSSGGVSGRTNAGSTGGGAAGGRATGGSAATGSSASSGGTGSSGAGSASSGDSGTSNSDGGSGSVASGGGSLPDLAARPPIPDPALARAVEVSGVVLVGSKYQAIVKAPDEPTSRYVTAGQRLSGGRVLVKRIENQGSEPVVILEEDGVEVVRSVGAPAEGSSGDATALLPELSPAS